MKKTNAYLFAVLLAALAGCNLLENDLTLGKPRKDYERSGNDADSLNNIESPADPTMSQITADTTVFVSAVRCSPGYDWQRDTAYGCADARLILYKNGEEIIDIPAGDGTCVSAAPDMHHILDGHLYTEYCDYSKTVICRDGEELYTIKGREVLKGLLVRDSVLHTLSLNLSSGGLVYRIDGEKVFSKAGAVVFGGFDDPSYGSGGALYEDLGSVCFAFKVKSTYYIVRDGLATVADVENATDLKSVDGKDVAVGAGALGHRWKDDRIWNLGASYLVSGESADPGENGVFRVVDATTRKETSFNMEKAVIYCAWGACRAVDQDVMERECFCFSSRCAALAGEELAVLHTPRDGSAPYLSIGGKKTMFEGLEGYLTGVAVTISLPRLLPAPHH